MAQSPLASQRVRTGADSASAALHEYDAAARELFHRTTRLAASLLDIPVALITVADDDRLHFVSSVGPEHPWDSTAGNSAHPLGLPARDQVTAAAADRGRSRRPARAGQPGDRRARDRRLPRRPADRDPAATRSARSARSTPRRGSGRRRASASCETSPRRSAPISRLAPRLSSAGSGLNIAAVAHRTGIGADTLRKWERRYGVLRPSRTAGGPAPLRRTRRRARGVASRPARGRLPDRRSGRAARRRISANAESSAPGLRDAIVAAVADDGHPSARRARRAVVHPLRRRDGGRGDRRAGAASRSATAGRPEHGAASPRSTCSARSCWRGCGRCSATGAQPVRGTAVLACAPGERHELGLLALAVLLQADGWLAVYLGADTPLDAAVATALRTNADLLCLSASDAAARDGARSRARRGGAARQARRRHRRGRRRSRAAAAARGGRRRAARAAGPAHRAVIEGRKARPGAGRRGSRPRRAAA